MGRFTVALLVLVAVIAQAAPVSYTTKGRIVLSCDGTEVSQHVVESEWNERAVNYALGQGGKAICTVKYPDKVVVFDIPLQASAPPLAAPTNLTGTIAPGTLAGKSDVTLTWTAVTGATGYEIERCTSSACVLYTSPGPSYVNGNLPGGITYTYRVRAVDATRHSAYSSPYTVLTPTASTAGTATIKWLPPTLNNDGTPLDDLAGYELYWTSVESPTPRAIRIEGPGVSEYVFAGPPGHYTFWLHSFDRDGQLGPMSEMATKAL